jgi:probable HAF family extracellular repeat protein
LGGSYSNAFAINDKGEIAGWSTVAGDTTVHAVLWRKGNVIDLGTFGGPNSITGIFSGSSVTEKGMIPGRAETLTPDSLGEDFCFFGTNLVCLPLVRRDGELTPLPTLGGDNGFGNRMNGLGAVVGLAENTTHDPSCSAPQVLQFKPVVWLNGEIHELPTVPGFPDGIATSINDKGQVVGVSANCSLSAAHALLWDHGKVTDLGNLGGVSPVPVSFKQFWDTAAQLCKRLIA